MITLTQLKYIVTLNKEGHFRRAAEACNVSQPSLSTQVQKVEEFLGLVLFDRSKKPIRLTAEGKVFVEKAREILKLARDLEHSVQNMESVSGDFSLGVIPTLAPYLLPYFLEPFSQKYPHLNFSVYEKTTPEIIKDLYDDRLDAGLLVTPLRDDKLIERSLFEEAFCFYAYEGHPLKVKDKIPLKDLRTVKDLWLLSEGNCFRNQTLNLCGKKNQAHKNIFFESGSLETIKSLVRRGSGSTILPDLAVGGLKNNVIPFEEPVPTRQVGLAYSRSFLKEKIIDALENEILENLPAKIKNLKYNSCVIEIY